MPKPRIKPNYVATGDAHREIAYSFNNGERSQSTNKGGMLSIRNDSDGRLHLSVWRADPGVLVSVSTDSGDPYLSVLRDVTNAMLGVLVISPNATADDYYKAIAEIAPVAWAARNDDREEA